MPKRKHPEQRSTTSAPQPGQAPSQPSGNEIYRSQAGSSSSEAEREFTPEEMAELEELEHAAAEAYARVMDAAARLADRAADAYDTGRAFVRDNPSSTVVGAFAVGLLLGMLSSR